MTNRKFSSERLYKLVRFMVIIISVFSAVIAIVNFRALTKSRLELDELYKINKLLHDEVQITEREYNELYTTEIQGKITDKEKQQIEKYRKIIFNDDRIHSLIAWQNDTGNRIFLFSLVTIGLPILFFGGGGVYRYLFPITKGGEP